MTDVAIFEARGRIGGRILTHRDAREPLPIELGPEFIHGGAEETNRLLREAGLLAIQVEGKDWEARKSKLRRYRDLLARRERDRAPIRPAIVHGRHPDGTERILRVEEPMIEILRPGS
ncbi:MAG TPA: FAD-dependent oxidoreductase [Thermoanaerobaculia bacterium]|nr:FAD-dependent oxidoreductase [Thermoanaerobaculia bacterium]